MRRLLFAAVLAGFAAACSKKPAEPAPIDVPAPLPPEIGKEESDSVHALQWTAASNTGATLLVQTADATGKCKTSCTVAGAEVWTGNSCLGKRIDLRFVAEDCERAVIIHPAPATPDIWQHAQVAHVYGKGGKLLYAVNAGAVIKGKQAERGMDLSVRWLQGTSGVPGEPPTYTRDGEKVLFRSVDGREQTIPLGAK